MTGPAHEGKEQAKPKAAPTEEGYGLQPEYVRAVAAAQKDPSTFRQDGNVGFFIWRDCNCHCCFLNSNCYLRLRNG
ncbi:MAG: hypothetical protein IH999_10790 [Proteobacteria bacterium]|nr:hypothetical protein [Pseudomonadota bacterium]